MCVIYVIDTINEDVSMASIKERLRFKALAIVIIKFEGDGIDDYD